MESSEIINRNNELLAELKKYPENTKEYRDIVAKIVKNNGGLVKYVAQRYFSALQGSTLNSDDLIAEGYFGLLKAVKWFKAEKGNFSTYAGRYIENEIIYRLKRERKHQYVSSLEDNPTAGESKLELGGVLASPVNMEEEFIEKDETQQQLAWVRENLDRLPSFQRQVLTAKYLSGEASLRGDALSSQFDCSRQYISCVEQKAITKLKMFAHKSHQKAILKLKKVLANEPHQEEVDLTSKAEMKAVLKDLILTELTPGQQRAMLSKFYTNTTKTNAQVAQELDSNKSSVSTFIHLASKKLCTLCDSVQDIEHLKSILEYRLADPEKER